MKKIKNNYTKFILTVIAVAMIGILFKGQIIKPAHAQNLGLLRTLLGEDHEKLNKNRIEEHSEIEQLILAKCN